MVGCWTSTCSRTMRRIKGGTPAEAANVNPPYQGMGGCGQAGKEAKTNIVPSRARGDGQAIPSPHQKPSR